VRSHYGNSAVNDREKIYRAGNALATWLGLTSWTDIVEMQSRDRVDEFRRQIQEAA